MKRIFVVLCSVILLSSCSKENNDMCNYDPCAVAAPASEVTQLEAYLASATITATKHCSGMYYTIDAPGSGATATICSTVSVKYKGQLTNGTVFDQSTASVSFQLGGLIEAWKKGIPMIKPGGKIKLYCPPSLAYGSQANGTIPANSILIFEVELVSVL
ncbi:MAG TPA: FKBP-type peptidyl-prolyl cis-trans isomerase [Chitinophagaceae bacterium]|nr:FKBP-type peptidyl-prolyl cis-trans isomerase [Chitinophagaceae bacterium]